MKSEQRKALEAELKLVARDIQRYERARKATEDNLEALNKRKRQLEMALARIP